MYKHISIYFIGKSDIMISRQDHQNIYTSASSQIKAEGLSLSWCSSPFPRDTNFNG